MDDARTRSIIGGVAALLIAAAVFPSVVGTLLMLFSVLVLIFAIVGAVWPSILKLPNRLASVWVFTLAFGMFLGGGMLISPPNGNGAASDAPDSELTAEQQAKEQAEQERLIQEQIEADRRRHERRQANPVPLSPSQAQGTQDTVSLCHDYVQARVSASGTGVRLDFPAFMDGARGAQHLGGTEYAFESYVDLIDGRESTRVHYHCRVENGTVIAFSER